MNQLNNNVWTPKTILAISAHADDIELGAGGAIHKWTHAGARVFSFIFSTLKQRELRLPEIMDASRKLGIREDDVTILDYPNRVFPKFRQDILQNMVDLSNEIKPDIVLVPMTTDRHQDHEVITDEATRAYKKTILLGYESPWNMTQSSLQLTVLLSRDDVEAKQKAAISHKTEEYRPYINKEFIVSLACVRGKTAGGDYGESYEVIRWIM